jgi:hypothetical protein
MKTAFEDFLRTTHLQATVTEFSLQLGYVHAFNYVSREWRFRLRRLLLTATVAYCHLSMTDLERRHGNWLPRLDYDRDGVDLLFDQVFLNKR